MTTLLALLPDQNPAPPPAQGPEFGGSSPIGLVVTLFLLIAVIFLIRSMNKHLKKVPPSFDPPEEKRVETPPGQDSASAQHPAESRDAAPGSGTTPPAGT